MSTPDIVEQQPPALRIPLIIEIPLIYPTDGQLRGTIIADTAHIKVTLGGDQCTDFSGPLLTLASRATAFFSIDGHGRYTAGQAAAKLNCTRTAVYYALKHGHFRGHKVARVAADKESSDQEDD